MKETLTELVFILDRSGSMHGLEVDTIGGFNSMLEQQKALGQPAYVSTVLFDHEQKVVHDRVPLQDVEPLTKKDYVTRGSTALLDAICKSIQHIGNIHKYAREEDRPAKTLFVITTDGYENSSCGYTYAETKRMIERQKEAYGWEFLFLGANIDAAQVAENIGIARNRTANVTGDGEGQRIMYDTVSTRVVSRILMAEPSGGSAVNLDEDWNEAIEEDYRRRGGKRRR